MTQTKRLIVSLVTATSFLMPSMMSACDTAYIPEYGNGGIMQTPLSAKGRFVFVTRLSRRRLKEAVTLYQQPYRPMLMKAEI